MTRLQSTLLVALVAAGGVGIAAYLQVTVPPKHERKRIEFREQRPFRFGDAHVVSARLVNEWGTIAFERDEVFEWILTEPHRWPAKPDVVIGALTRVTAMAAEREVYPAPTDAELDASGLAPPLVSFELELGSGEKHRLELGAINALSELVYARANGGAVFLTRPQALWAMNRPFAEFRRSHVLPFDRSNMRILEKRVDGRSAWALRRDREGFSVRVGEGRWERADVGKASVAMAAAFLRLEADGWLVDGASSLEDALSQLEGARSRVAFVLNAEHASGRTRSATVAVVKRATAPEATPLVYTEGSLVEVYAPPAQELAELDPSTLINRTISQFEPGNVREVVVLFAGSDPLRIERTAAGDWPVQFDAERVDRTLEVFSELSGVSVVSATPSDKQLEEWLLQPPSRRFVFRGEGGDILANVTIGGYPDADHFYVRGTERRVYTVPIALLSDLPVDVAAYAR